MCINCINVSVIVSYNYRMAGCMFFFKYVMFMGYEHHDETLMN